MEIDLNKLSTKEVFELIEKLNNRFTAIKGWGLIKDKIIEDFDECSYLIESGVSVDNELIEEFFNEFEYDVEDGECWTGGYKCDDCGLVQSLWHE